MSVTTREPMDSRQQRLQHDVKAAQGRLQENATCPESERGEFVQAISLIAISLPRLADSMYAGILSKFRYL
jgi:hypothetical protein